MKFASRRVSVKVLDKGEDSLRSKGGPAVADDGRLLATVGVEEQAVSPLGVRGQGEDGPWPAHVRREGPHDGVVSPQPVAVVVIVHDGDLYRHAVEIDHTIDHAGRLRRRHAWGNDKKRQGKQKQTNERTN